MNLPSEEIEGVVIRESRVVSVKQKTAMVIVVFAMVLLVGGWLFQDQIGAALSPEPEFAILESASTNLVERAPIDVVPMGNLLYIQTEAQKEGTPAEPMAYQYDVSVNSSSKLYKNSVIAYLPQSSTTAVIITKQKIDSIYEIQLLDTTKDTVSTLKTVQAASISDAALSINKKFLAYSKKTNTSVSEGSDSNDGSIDAWDLVVTSFEGEASDIVITAATEPEWILNDTAILFMKSDGLHVMDLNTGYTALVAESNTQLITYDDMSISSDTAQMILTRPQENTIKIFSLIKDDRDQISFKENSQIYSDLISYSSPVFSPTGEFYSVIASTVSEVKKSGDIVTYQPEISIETRHISSAEVVKDYKIVNPIIGGAVLTGWLIN